MSVDEGIYRLMAKVDFVALATSAEVIDGQLHMTAPFTQVCGYKTVSFAVAGRFVAPRGHEPFTATIALDPPGGNWRSTISGIYRDTGDYDGNQATYYFSSPCRDALVGERGTYTVRIYLDSEEVETLEFTSEDPIGTALVAASQASISATDGPSGEDDGSRLLGDVQKMLKSADDALQQNDGQQNQDGGQLDGDYYEE